MAGTDSFELYVGTVNKAANAAGDGAEVRSLECNRNTIKFRLPYFVPSFSFFCVQTSDCQETYITISSPGGLSSRFCGENLNVIDMDTVPGVVTCK